MKAVLGKMAWVAVTALSPILAASAQSIGTACNSYYPIRQQGAACFGPNVGFSMTRPDGVTVCCVAQPQSSSGGSTRGTIYGPSEGERIAAGLALGIEGVQLLAEIIGWLSASTSSSVPPESYEDRQRREQVEQQDRAIAAERAVQNRNAEVLKQGGLAAAKAGNYRTALGDFKRCRDLATIPELMVECGRQLASMDAYLYLQEALALWAEGKRGEASQNFAKAVLRAGNAERSDIASRINAYRAKLNAEIEKLPAQERPKSRPTTECVNMNGRLVCE